MTPAARVQAAIELLDLIIVAARDGGAAADTIIARWFAGRRYAGSKDRRAIRDLVYGAIRRSGDPPRSGRAAILGLAQDRPELVALFDGSGYGPETISPSETIAAASLVPGWLKKEFSQSLDRREWDALLDRAPLDARINTLKADRVELEGATPVAGVPNALRLPEGTNVETLPAYRDGLIEVQDAGSQLTVLAAEATPGMTIVDLCAGAGGKTLALAAALSNAGRIIATDTDRGRLSRLPQRAARAGVTIVETRLLNPGREAEALADLQDSADLVLIDAPCSGTGTWRRNPEARWRLDRPRLDRLTALQTRLIGLGASLVRPGGCLVYVVCSLLDTEGPAIVARFLADHPEWRATRPAVNFGRPHGPGLRLTPAHDRTDGFFFARLARS